MTRNSQSKSKLLYIALMLLTLVQAGCKKEQTPVAAQAPPPAAAQKPVQAVVSSVSKLQHQTAVFDFSGKRDPFKPFAEIKPEKKTTPEDLKRARIASLPIHSYDVSQFSLIGVVIDPKGNQAMVIDPNKKGYVLKVGMTIGKNNGRVMAIQASEIDVLEQFRDENGKVRKEHIKIPLPRKL